MKLRIRLAAGLAMALAASAVPLSAQMQGRYYLLTNEFLGASHALDVGQTNSGVWFGIALPAGTGSGQNWHFTPLGNDWYRLSNKWNGNRLCLDVAGDGFTYMDTCAPRTGQRWKIETINGYLVFKNAYKPGMCLDVASDPGRNVALMTRCANLSGQLWTMTDSRVSYP